MKEWKMDMLYYDHEKDLHDKQQKALQKIHTLILESISLRMINHTAYTDIDPYDTLVALKKRLKPTYETRALWAEKRYHQLAKGPTNQDVDSWLDEWIDVYHEAKRMEIVEVSGDRAIRDFLMAIENIDPVYSNTRKNFRNLAAHSQHGQRTMDEEIEEFRYMTLLLQTRTSLATDAKATDPKTALKSKNQEGKNIKKDPPTCICGDKMWYSDCPYIVPSKASAGWKADPIKRLKVNEALKDIKVQARVTKHLENRANIEASLSDSTDTLSVFTTARTNSNTSYPYYVF